MDDTDPRTRTGLGAPRRRRRPARQGRVASWSSALLLVVSLASRGSLAEPTEEAETTGAEQLEQLEERIEALEQAASVALHRAP